jgi:uncharacterized protein YceH (UPF0502 family)
VCSVRFGPPAQRLLLRRAHAMLLRGQCQENALPVELNELEIRVIACLIEKQITTPDQYPLSLNALTNACNQKSNRDPVLALDDATVQRTIDALSAKHLVLERSGFGSRVPKYQHRFCNTGFGSLELSAHEVAVLTELMLRGPQTPGELRSRATRMAAIHAVDDVEAALESLATRPDGALVVRLAREPGRREARYAHLLAGEPPAGVAPAHESAAPAAVPEASDTAERIAQLEAALERLEQRLTELERRRV